jgi:predicted RNA-binding protein associated with RNAse of E/G family
MLIRKCDAAGTEQTRYAGAVVKREGALVVIAARWERGPAELGYTTFMPGDRFTEYFYTDQWFNIMRIGAAADDALKGWYCNVSYPPEVSDEAITYRDLLLDVWVGADGATLVLDEDEFAAADLDAATKAAAVAGLTEVLRWAQHHQGPFAELADAGQTIFVAGAGEEA